MIKKLRFYYLLLVAYSKRNTRQILRLGLYLLFVFVFFRLTFFGFWQPLVNRTTAALSKTTYIEGKVGSVKSLNPIFEATEAEKEINQLIFRGLTKIGPSGQIETDLAENYELFGSTDYIFRLKKNIYWQDGKKFTADDVVYTIRQAQDPNLAASARTAFKDVGIEKLDEYTIKFTLKEPFAPFLSQTTLGIIPAHISLKSYRPVGTSGFRVASFSREKIVLTNSKRDLVFKLYPTAEKAILALKQGEIKALGGLSRNEIEQFKNWHNLKIYSQTLPSRVVTIFFNTRAEFVSDKLVRQALAQAAPKEKLLNFANPASEQAQGPFPKENSLGLRQAERFPLDLAKAAQRLESSGWKKQNSFLKKAGKTLTLTLTLPRDPDFEKIAAEIGAMWAKLGIAFQTIELGSEELTDAIKRTQFQAVLTTAEISDDPDQYVLWHSTQIAQGNITSIASPKLDKLLEDGRKSNDLKIRKDRYTEFVRILADESPAIFLYYPGYSWVVNARINNIELNYFQSPADRFQNVSSWKIPKLVI
ncbi:MAG: ABC transporter substrate-binding protein [bacterium]|nr:ABC transporter substrate-binding protein [bacterium]